MIAYLILFYILYKIHAAVIWYVICGIGMFIKILDFCIEVILKCISRSE